jgi:lipoprotein-anchoring transpeptidase ErfK/SrfK
MEGIKGVRAALAAACAAVGIAVAGPSVVAAGAAGAAQQSDEFALAREYPPESGSLRLEVSLSERELYIFIEDEVVRTLPVSVGKPGHETITGSYGIHHVDWNPDWTPPDSDWSADSEYKAPGAEGNPMGRARLIFRAPYSIHGTDAVESLGGAESHGSIRVSNEDVFGLARLVQEHGGEERPESWYRTAVDTPTEMFEVPLPDPVSITIRE